MFLLTSYRENMPAQRLRRVSDEGIYCHIYNKGIENKDIFVDQNDYNAFVNFLDEYLTDPKSAEDSKKTFTVNGREYKGVPHLPKNYSKDVELIAYGLTPKSFDLILRQLNKNSLANFMRSICTRYSIYFNKRYGRTGSLFAGPYKSLQIKDDAELVKLTSEIHAKGNNSSYKEYLGERNTGWIKSEEILDNFSKLKEDLLKDFKSYKDYVEASVAPLERSNPSDKSVLEPSTQVVNPVINNVTVQKRSNRLAEFGFATALFFVLTFAAIKNINASGNITIDPKSEQVVLSATIAEATVTPVPTPSATPTAIEKLKVIVVLPPNMEHIGIRSDAGMNASVIGQAGSGDVFEAYFEPGQDWYGVTLPDGQVGFISKDYVEKYQNTN